MSDAEYTRDGDLAALIDGITLAPAEDEDRGRVGLELPEAMLAAFRKTRARA